MAAIGASGALLALALTPAALASGSARAVGRIASGARVAANTLPNTDIKGKPAHFSPSKLSATARWDRKKADCASQASFTIVNRKSKAETIKFTGTDHFKSSQATVPAKEGVYDCVSSGYHGTLTGKLSDGKKLTVKF